MRAGDGARAGREQDVRHGFIAVGRVVGPWGTHGAMRVASLTDFAERFTVGAAVYVRGDRRSVRASRRQGRAIILSLEGIDDADAAGGLRGEYLEIPEEEATPLPEGEYYRWQLEGLEVVTAGGKRLGMVTRVLETGAHDVLEVRDEAGGEKLVPFVDEIVSVEPGRRVVVTGEW